MITINFRILQAAMLIAPKKDVRYYLNGVLIEPEKVVVTDGHRLLVIPYEKQGDFEPFIISGEAIQRLHSQLSAKQRREGVVNIKLSDLDNHRASEMECFGMISFFQPVDGKYPEWRRVVPKDKSSHTDTLEFHGLYNWEYMSDFTKVAKILEPGNKHPLIEMLADGKNNSLVKFLNGSGVIGCIMPIHYPK